MSRPRPTSESTAADAGLNELERVRLWRRVEATVARRARRKRLWVAAPLCAAAAIGLWFLGGERLRPSTVAKPASQLRGPPADPCRLDPAAGRFELGAGCGPQLLELAGDQWLMSAESRVQRLRNGARVVQGEVRFTVRPRGRERFVVEVSHGAVQVIGTVFQVVQRDGHGQVSVLEGVVEFVWADGSRERVSAGQSLSWPRPPPAETEQAAPAASEHALPQPATGQARRTPVDMEQVTDRLLQLRSQRRYPEAVSLLQQTLREPGLRLPQRARISYELGLMLEAAGRPACGHWRKHQRRFGKRLHAAEISDRLQACRAP